MQKGTEGTCPKTLPEKELNKMITSIIKCEKKAMTQLPVLQIYWAQEGTLALLGMFMEYRKGEI